MESTLYIEAMDCEEEAKLIRASLHHLNGLEKYEINIISKSVKVTCDPTILPIESIVKAIGRTGMKAVLKKGEKGREGGKWWREPRIVTLSLCGILILISLVFEHLFGLAHSTALFLYGTAVLVGGYYPAKMGLLALKNLSPNIRTLMVAGAAGAISLGLWEEAALLVLIYSLGDVLEAYAADRVRGAVRALMGLTPKEALVRRNEKEIALPLEEVKVGDTMIIKPGERLPLDGEVMSGTSSVDQSPVTGESIPVSKEPGDEVFAGSINQAGSMEVRVTKPFNDTTLGRIIHYVEEAEARKSRYQRFGDTFGKYYTPSMFGFAILIMVIPGGLFGNWAEWFYRGLVVLVVSCSCGIALSIPVSVVATIANAARHGILIKGGAHIEAASRIRAMAFDKTGSLTLGKPVVTDIVSFGAKTEEEILSLASSIESRSEHVLADAILERAGEERVAVQDVGGFEAVPGLGARAVIGGRPYGLGSSALCSADSISSDARERIEKLEGEGKTLILLTEEDDLIGAIAVRDEIRPEARDTVVSLKSLGVTNLTMLTGDNEKVARVMSEKSGTDEYMARLMPEDKVKAIVGLKGKYGDVAMVGDGVNDAPAMVASDLGIAMGAAGTDVAIETGDIVLMSDDLSKIPYLIGLGRRTVRNMRFSTKSRGN
ncbi:MAG: heavy metal translocating P-type ATPase [Thermodesulfobacteriota bacterium]